MEQWCQQFNLLNDDAGIVRVPFLVKGRIIAPPPLDRSRIVRAFAGMDATGDYVKLPEAQLLRQRVIERSTMRETGDYLYQVLPLVDGPALLEHDTDRLAHGLYALPVEDILAYLERIAGKLAENEALTGRVRELCRRIADFPDLYLDGAFATFQAGLDPQAAQSTIDSELGAWGLPGSCFLDGWVDVPGTAMPGLTQLAVAGLLGGQAALGEPDKTRLRAMPTRQLHITAGNAPEIPIISALRAILTKSAAVIKCPHEATLPGALFALALASAAPEHPLTQNLSVVYWQGGDPSVENVLFGPGAFDRIVVWGAPATVAAVQSRAPFTRTICFNPRYGASLIGREAFADLARVTTAALADAVITNQKACTASLVQYVEGGEEEAQRYANALRQAFAEWDRCTPQYIAPAIRGQIKRMRRGRYARATWHVNETDGEFTSGVVVMSDEFDILDHPMCRLVIVRPVADLTNALVYLHHAVSTVGVYPEPRRLALCDSILARGVSKVLPLGQCEQVIAGAPHDGMLVLNQLVDWKSG